MKIISLLIFVCFSNTVSLAQGLTPDQEFLKKLVSISSDSADPKGVDAVQDLYAAKLTELGFTIERIANPLADVSSGKLLVATRPGAGKYITWVGHADTVFQKLNPFEVVEGGKIAKGSGVSDDKGGVVVGLAALRSFIQENKNDKNFPALRFVTSPSEETGSKGFREKLKEYALDSRLIIGLEAAREDGSFITARKGVRWYQIKITGKEAHAGVEPEMGVNACVELATKLQQIHQLNRFKTGTTVTVGHIEGGKDKYNIVCGDALAKIDVRFYRKKEAEQVFQKMEKILKTPEVKSYKTKQPTEISFSVTLDVPTLEAAPASEKWNRKYSEILKGIEHADFHGIPTGGAADLNAMAGTGVPMLDGMGPMGGKYHTNDEFIVLGSIETRARALAELVKVFCN